MPPTALNHRPPLRIGLLRYMLRVGLGRPCARLASPADSAMPCYALRLHSNHVRCCEPAPSSRPKPPCVKFSTRLVIIRRCGGLTGAPLSHLRLLLPLMLPRASSAVPSTSASKLVRRCHAHLATRCLQNASSTPSPVMAPPPCLRAASCLSCRGHARVCLSRPLWDASTSSRCLRPAPSRHGLAPLPVSPLVTTKSPPATNLPRLFAAERPHRAATVELLSLRVANPLPWAAHALSVSFA